MEKRYQVFISSTFQDLQNARQEVSQALLRADCFPAGMELFPAADEEQFEFIKTIIDQSDYYILISAGRYGSIHPETGLSYTEMEYDYAVEIGKPIIRLLHKDPFNELKGEFIEKTDAGRTALDKFRAKLSDRRMVKFWQNELELGNAVDHGLRNLIKTRPTVGWVQANRADSEIELENYKLKELLSSTNGAQNDSSTSRTLLQAGLTMTSKVFDKLEATDTDLDLVKLTNELSIFFVDYDYLNTSMITELADKTNFRDTDLAAVLYAMHMDGLLNADDEGDYVNGPALNKFVRSLPMLEVLSR
ncbi:DUF4062 domain-containing protein [Cognatishimia sp. 1_MG-2023]|uniref:DUF4062 domain-containing protein n=1 Tax=Cognatishimia sp. 1_MG-2023 TaxID=3062642 RepID=UPI0026E137E4|nr:DUF4062 domain-containing protein [Cognatishimia sp. 1_MG-2023]MDO6726347.1 DUF4062 domain-containing protein [Cognatishimia sp. 1_MG-2023]